MKTDSSLEVALQKKKNKFLVASCNDVKVANILSIRCYTTVHKRYIGEKNFFVIHVHISSNKYQDIKSL